MRTAFVESLFESAKMDRRTVLITGDLGFGVFTQFMKQLPEQFVNAGVAEQNMTGLAVGMALSGKIVFTYSIANFPVLRCVEQIRNDVCYHNANVKIVAVGGGMAYGALGISHHATEDVAVMRALPNLSILAPNDPIEAALATKWAASIAGPFYLRLGRSGERTIHSSTATIEFGKAVKMREGSDVSLLVTGGLLEETLKAADLLAAQGITSRVLSVHTIKPLDEQAIMAAARETGALFTIEEHSIIGGLGSAVAEVVLESGISTTFKRIGLPNTFSSKVGDQNYLRNQYGLDSIGIAGSVSALLRSRGGKDFQNRVERKK